MKVLIVVDMQRDFVNGSLGTKEAVRIVDNVAERIEVCGKDGYEIIFTKDTHGKEYLETQEGKNLPVPHCIKGEPGWDITEKLQKYVTGETKVYEKDTFASTELGEALKNQAEQVEEIELIGLCTDICVISNALLLKGFLPEVPIKVNQKCCAGVTPESHNNALTAMKMCQVEVV